VASVGEQADGVTDNTGDGLNDDEEEVEGYGHNIYGRELLYRVAVVVVMVTVVVVFMFVLMHVFVMMFHNVVFFVLQNYYVFAKRSYHHGW
jgi:hypothetical protein